MNREMLGVSLILLSTFASLSYISFVFEVTISTICVTSSYTAGSDRKVIHDDPWHRLLKCRPIFRASAQDQSYYGTLHTT